jgi:hypothetical protein
MLTISVTVANGRVLRVSRIVKITGMYYFAVD